MSVNRFRKDNRGSAFIAVLVSVLFIGIIAAIVIFISRTNIENSRTSIASTDNFYEGEVALDELKDSLKGIAEEAIVEAYKKWLQEYTLVNAADQTKKFNELFSESFQDKVKDYFKITGIATPEGGYKDYKELMYDVADETLVKTGASETTPEYSIDTETGTVTISDVSVLQKDENNNTTRISTDLILSIKTPSVELGTSRGVNNNIKDYILIADGEIRLSGAGTNQTIIGDIYGGGKLEGDTNGVYTGSGLLLDNAKNVMLYSDHIITRSSIRTQNGSILNVFGKNQYGYGAWDWAYSEIWAKNLVMDGSGSSIMKIQGSCNIADDLSIDSNNSEFKLMGDQSTYYGYNTSSNGNDAETSSSIVINGKNVNLDLTSASMLWLAGKSYVEVPSVWGYKKNNTASIGGTNIDVKSSTFMQGESISYRSLQSSYLLPGDCIVGIYHNPMTKAEFDTIKANSKEAFDSLDDAARAGASYIDLSKGVANNGINLEQYLDYASPY